MSSTSVTVYITFTISTTKQRAEMRGEIALNTRAHTHTLLYTQNNRGDNNNNTRNTVALACRKQRYSGRYATQQRVVHKFVVRARQPKHMDRPSFSFSLLIVTSMHASSVEPSNARSLSKHKVTSVEKRTGQAAYVFVGSAVYAAFCITDRAERSKSCGSVREARFINY